MGWQRRASGGSGWCCGAAAGRSSRRQRLWSGACGTGEKSTCDKDRQEAINQRSSGSDESYRFVTLHPPGDPHHVSYSSENFPMWPMFAETRASRGSGNLICMGAEEQEKLLVAGPARVRAHWLK